MVSWKYFTKQNIERSIKKKNKYMTNAKNNTLTKTTKEQQRFGGHPTIVDASGYYTTKILEIS